MRKGGGVVIAVLMVAMSIAGCSGSESTKAASESPGPATRTASTSASPTTADPGDIGLAVPTIDLTVPLHAEGLRAGVINPKPGTAMWFNGYGRVIPGEQGTAVVAAHVASSAGPDVFAKLKDIEVGDSFAISAGDDPGTEFVVTQAFAVDKDKLRSNPTIWGENAAARRVVLVTCDDGLGYRDDGHRVANFVVVGEVR